MQMFRQPAPQRGRAPHLSDSRRFTRSSATLKWKSARAESTR